MEEAPSAAGIDAGTSNEYPRQEFCIVHYSTGWKTGKYLSASTQAQMIDGSSLA